MNLIKIQEELKGFPTQTIMSYANGANPEVPPYMALAELSRRKTTEQRRAEPPTQSVKEKLESEIENPQGIAQLPEAGTQPAAPPQGVPQRPPQGPPGMPPGMPQGAPQGMPPRMPPRPPGMAAGGITRIPTRSDMFHYAPGGIVAFAEGGELTPEDMGAVRGPMGDINTRLMRQTALNPFPSPTGSIPGEERPGQVSVGYHNPALDLPGALESKNKGAQPSGIAALPETAQLQDLVPLASQKLREQMLGEFNPPQVQSKEDIRKAMIADALAEGNVDKAKMLSQLPGDALIPLIKQLSQQNEEQRAGFKEGQGRVGLAALSNALIAAGEATRGQKGAGFLAGGADALGGFGKSYNAYTAEDVKRLEAQKAVERAQSIEVATLQSKVDDLRAAHANGTIQDQQEAQKAVQEQAYKMQALQMGSAGAILAQALAQAQAQTTKEHYAATEKQAQEALEATKGHYAATERQGAAALKAQQELRQDAIDQRARGKLDEAMKGDTRIQMLAKRLNDPVNPVEIGSDQYNTIMDEVEKIRRKIIAEHPDFDIPDTSGTPQYAKDKNGNVIVSYDDWKTNQPVKRAITGGR